VFAYDHLFPMGSPQRPAVPCLPLLAAIAMETERVMEAVDAQVTQEMGEDPDETPQGTLAAELARLNEPLPGEDDPALNWGAPQKLPRPSKQMRAQNFQAMVRRLFTERDPRGIRLEDGERVPSGTVEAAPDGTRWWTGGTDTLAALWLDFPGEDVRPALYPRLQAHALTTPPLARQLQRGQWAISEHVLQTPLVIPDGWSPPEQDLDDDGYPVPSESDEDTLRDLAPVDA